MNLDNYFDIRDLYFNELVGSIWLGFFIGILVILAISAKKNLPFDVTLLLCLVWGSAVFSVYTGMIVIWVFIALGAGIVFYDSVRKFINR